ncbi:MAG TPA: SHOCT domain-containing protein [Methanothrix sp.]|nr:SHOCT domain-containing protein [Methanothrix sp.]HRW82029.1 SHOCT domain-containing protein [Methanothrix sp.]
MIFRKKEDNPLDKKPLNKVKDLLVPDEEVLYIYDRPIKPGDFRLVLTNKRFIQVCNVTGYVDSTSWDSFMRVWVEKNILKLNYLGTAILPMKGLPKEDMDKIYNICKDKIDAVSETSEQTPTQNLKHLKDMFDAGLISQTEYETKKGDLLSRM